MIRKDLYRQLVSFGIIDDDINITLAGREGFHGKVGRCADDRTGWFYARTVSAYSAQENTMRKDNLQAVSQWPRRCYINTLNKFICQVISVALWLHGGWSWFLSKTNLQARQVLQTCTITHYPVSWVWSSVKLSHIQRD